MNKNKLLCFINCLISKSALNKIMSCVLAVSLLASQGAAVLADDIELPQVDETIAVSTEETGAAEMTTSGETTAPEGVVLFSEDFSGATEENQPIHNYNNWQLVTGDLQKYNLGLRIHYCHR